MYSLGSLSIGMETSQHLNHGICMGTQRYKGEQGSLETTAKERFSRSTNHFSFLFKRAVANQTKHDASPTKATWANRKLMRSAQQRCILLQTPLYPESPIYIGEMCAEIEESQLKGTRKEQHDLKKLGVCVCGACVCVCTCPSR